MNNLKILHILAYPGYAIFTTLLEGVGNVTVCVVLVAGSVVVVVPRVIVEDGFVGTVWDVTLLGISSLLMS